MRRGPADVGLGPDCTEKRSLRVGPHGKAQCAWLLAYRMRLLVRRADRVRFSVRGYHQSALFRDPGYPECAFPLRRRLGGAGRNPPPACGALWKVAQLGKYARATPRQAAGGLRRGPAGVGLGPDCTEKRSLRVGPHGKAQCAWLPAHRMRFSVTPAIQNALFRYAAAREARGATPPASLRGTMESGSTGQMRSSNPPPGCGGGLC